LRERILARWGTLRHQTKWFYFWRRYLPGFQKIISWEINFVNAVLKTQTNSSMQKNTSLQKPKLWSMKCTELIFLTGLSRLQCRWSSRNIHRFYCYENVHSVYILYALNQMVVFLFDSITRSVSMSWCSKCIVLQVMNKHYIKWCPLQWVSGQKNIQGTYKNTSVIWCMLTIRK
jgi:hypothetical protein